MKDQELVNALREHAEWQRGNEWETPITLGDDLVEAADRIANQNTHILALQQEIEKLRAQLRHLCRDCDLDRLEKLAEADRDGRLVALPCKVGDTLYEVTGRKTISEYRVKAIRVELFCVFIEWEIEKGFVWQSLAGITPNEIGKTVFLTREEAAKALEAMKNGN